MEPRFKRNDEVYLVEDRGKATRKKYRIQEYFLGDIPEPLRAKHTGTRKEEDEKRSDHNYMIVPVDGGDERMVYESEIE